MRFQKLLSALILFSVIFSLSSSEGASKKKKTPAKKTEGYYLAVRYFASDRKQFPAPAKK